MYGKWSLSPSGILWGSSVYGGQRNLVVVCHGRRSDEPGRQGFVCQVPTDGANCTGSKYSGVPVFLSSELRRRPITCEPTRVSYPAVCGRKNPPTVKLAHTLGGIESRERVFVCKDFLQRGSCVAYGGLRHAYISSEPHIHSLSAPDALLFYPICQHKPCLSSPALYCLPA